MISDEKKGRVVAYLKPCQSGQCDRLVSGLSVYCCTPCRAAWEATPPFEPHNHSAGCDQRLEQRRKLAP
jgi:hypothetical protein